MPAWIAPITSATTRTAQACWAAEIDAVINRPGATRLWNRATWQLLVGLLRQMGSNIDATGVIFRIDAINRRAELTAGRNA